MRLLTSLTFTVALLFALAACQQSKESTASEATTLPDSVTLIESVAASSGDGIVIPYKKYELDNGLTIILHQDLSDPLVHVDVTYHVGSAREEVGKSGFAHFFEHMMFQGSENVADEQHFKICLLYTSDAADESSSV